MNLVEAILVGGGGSGAVIFIQAAKSWLDARNSRHEVDRTADVKLEEHRDGLMFDLLRAARVEGEALRTELADLRPLVARLAHFEEALDHISALLQAEGDAERKAAQRRARAYLNRMRRLADAKGTIANEVQRLQSAEDLSKRNPK